MEREIIIMATSAKNHNFCVGGIDTGTGEWIRLVSNDKTMCEALTPKMITFETGEKCSPFDKIRVSIIKEVSMEHQPENLLIDETKKLKKIKKVSLDEALQIHPIENGREDVRRFLKNECPFFDNKEILEIKRSLYLIEVRNLKIYKNNYNKYKASFNYLGKDYINISMTDPTHFFMSNYSYDIAMIVLSLGSEPFKGNYYKYVVSIFPLIDELEIENEIPVGYDDFPF